MRYSNSTPCKIVPPCDNGVLYLNISPLENALTTAQHLKDTWGPFPWPHTSYACVHAGDFPTLHDYGHLPAGLVISFSHDYTVPQHTHQLSTAT